jgi:hypothetical protein
MFVLMLRHERIICGVQTTGPRRSVKLRSRRKNHKNKWHFEVKKNWAVCPFLLGKCHARLLKCPTQMSRHIPEVSYTNVTPIPEVSYTNVTPDSWSILHKCHARFLKYPTQMSRHIPEVSYTNVTPDCWSILHKSEVIMFVITPIYA